MIVNVTLLKLSDLLYLQSLVNISVIRSTESAGQYWHLQTLCTWSSFKITNRQYITLSRAFYIFSWEAQ